jgi:hypothetical protein
MNWASRRRSLYISGVAAFFAVAIGIPLVLWLYEPATCFDSIQNQTETAVDRGGPCKLLDARQLIPHSVLWARPFAARPGIHSAVAYIENPNKDAGVVEAPYRIKLYDDRNVLVAEREDITPIMPGTITPVFAADMGSGERKASRAFFEFLAPLVWERLQDLSEGIAISDKLVENIETSPRVTATVTNQDVIDFKNVTVVAVVFDTAGNAFAASRTAIPILEVRASIPVTFTWSDPFTKKVARVDVLVVVPPTD